jgi:hypothetical protein
MSYELTTCGEMTSVLSTEEAQAVTTGAEAAGTRRRLLSAGAWAAAAAAGFAVYLRLAQTRAVNSDGAALALQAWDMLHGNPLLRGWTTSDVSFYSTELPQYMLVERVRGLGAAVVPTAAAMTYTLVVLLAAGLAAGRPTGRAPGRAAWAGAVITAGIMLAPQLGAGTNVLLSSPDHVGTSVPLLLTWLVLDRAQAQRHRSRWSLPAVITLLLAWAQVADSIATIAGAVPLAVVCALRLARSARGRDWPAARAAAGLGAGALLSTGLAGLFLRLVHAAGGFTVRPLASPLASLGEILGHNLPVTGQCLLLLTGADVFATTGGSATVFAALHLAGTATAAAGIGLAAWRFRRLDPVGQVLLAAIAVNVVAFAVTDRVYAVSSAREIAPVLPYAAVLAGRLLGSRVPPGRRAGSRRVMLSALGLAAAGYLAGLGVELASPAAAPQAAPLSDWLERHPLGTGLSGYWEASIVTLSSGARVAVRPVTVTGGRVRPNASEVKSGWFAPGPAAAHYVVLFPGVDGYPGFTDRPAVLATFGRPARVYHAGRYTIWYWPASLLGDLRGKA